MCTRRLCLWSCNNPCVWCTLLDIVYYWQSFSTSTVPIRRNHLTGTQSLSCKISDVYISILTEVQQARFNNFTPYRIINQRDELLEHFGDIEFYVWHLIFRGCNHCRQHTIAKNIVRYHRGQIPNCYKYGHSVQVVRIVDQGQNLQTTARSCSIEGGIHDCTDMLVLFARACEDVSQCSEMRYHNLHLMWR